MRSYTVGRGWTTGDELLSIDYMASGAIRKNGKTSTKERLKRLKNYISTIEDRVWGTAQVNVATCKFYAVRKWQELTYAEKT